MHIKSVLSILIIFLCSACHEAAVKDEYSYYRAIEKRDTTFLRIQLLQGRFFGDYIFAKGDNYRVKGDFQGDVIGDTLTGSLVYTPFGHRNAKKAAFALLQSGDILQEGKGIQTIYLGVPFYPPQSLSFGSYRTFIRTEKQQIFENR